jgi:hypothetical protein
MNSQYPSSSSGRTFTSASPNNQTEESGVAQDMRAKAAEAASKIADVAQQAGKQAKETAAYASRKSKGLLNMQVTAGAELAGHIAESARCAADNLDQNAPQLAGLVRGAAERVEGFSRDIRFQTVEDLVRTASDFTRRQPALVFGLASLAGMLAFRVLKSSPPSRSYDDQSGDVGAGAGRFHGS